MEFTTRENWLKSAMAIIEEEILAPVLHRNALDLPPIRYSLTAPKTHIKNGKVLGECWARAASADGVNEVFLAATFDGADSVEVLAVAIHEYIHAALDNQHGHSGPFIDLCKEAGLEGGPTGRSKASFTATIAGPVLNAHLLDLVRELGDMPHGAMTPTLSGKKTQKNRQLLVKCSHCEFKFRASQKTIDSMIHNDCLACTPGRLAPAQD
jgi:hypothetical protein